MADPRRAPTPLFATEGIAWTGLFAGPLAWVFDEMASYALVPYACNSGRAWPMQAVSLGCLLLLLTGALLAWRDWRRRQAAPPEENRPESRGHFLALVGFLLCLLFGFAIATDVVAKLLLDPCLR
jgi:hypothetical protein